MGVIVGRRAMNRGIDKNRTGRAEISPASDPRALSFTVKRALENVDDDVDRLQHP
jgi:hypothetical protein